jgi:hypothetical protein
LDGGFGFNANLCWEGVGNGVYEGDDIVSLPYGADHVKDVLGDEGREAIDGEEEVRAGRVEFGYSEGDGGRGPYFALEEEVTLGFGEAVYEEGRWEAAKLFGFFAALRGGHTNLARFGDFCYCREDPFFHTVVEGDVLCFAIEGKCKKFSRIVLLPLSN